MSANGEAVADEDSRLLRAYAEGDDEAFAQLFQRNYDRVCRLAYRYTGSTTDAEALAQSVFLKVMRAAADFVPRARFTIWLFRVTANECLSHIRKVRREPTVMPTDDAVEPPGRSQPDPVEEAQRQELAREVRRAVVALPERQRLAVILARYEGLSYAEIAEALETSAQAVKSLLNRAHTALRGKLRRYVGSSESPET